MSRSCITKRLLDADEQQPLESQSLLSSFSQNESTSWRKVAALFVHSHLVRFCPMPKAAILVLSWAVFVGILHFMLSNFALLLLLCGDILPIIELPTLIVIYYSSFALVYIFYPLSGYLADVYCGRFRIIAGSLALLLFILIFCIIFYSLCLLLSLTPFWNIFLGSAGLVCVLIAVIGIAGFDANFIQFGLDQLLEAPSHHQALFVHWAKWCYDLMSVLILFMFMYVEVCLDPTWTIKLTSVSSLILLFELVLALLLIIGYWKRR